MTPQDTDSMNNGNITKLPKVLISGNWYALQEGCLIGGPLNADGTIAADEAVDIDWRAVDAQLREQARIAARALACPAYFLAAMQRLNDELVAGRSRGDGHAMGVERWECLLDSDRHDEAMEMLDDMQARLGVADAAIAAAQAALAERDTVLRGAAGPL